MTIPVEQWNLTSDTISLEAQWSRWTRRYSWHLDQLPGLFEAMRADVVPLGAVAYDRDRVDMSRDGAPVPFRVEAVDAIDDLWAALIEYADHVDALLIATAPVVLAPLPRVGRWSLRSGVQGARPGADLRRDAFAIIGWLVERVDWIVPLAALSDSEAYLFDMIRACAKRYLSPRREPKRACRVCGARLITLRWTSRGEVSTCGGCGTERVLEVRRPLMSDACWEKQHAGCQAVTCSCSCHLQRSASLYTVRVPVKASTRRVAVPAMSESCAHSEWPTYRDDEDARRCSGCGGLR